MYIRHYRSGAWPRRSIRYPLERGPDYLLTKTRVDGLFHSKNLSANHPNIKKIRPLNEPGEVERYITFVLLRHQPLLRKKSEIHWIIRSPSILDTYIDIEGAFNKTTFPKIMYSLTIKSGPFSISE